MRIALFGKFPPIQGGVSSQVYEFAEAARGSPHEVHIFSNANEVEAGVRAVLSQEDIDRMEQLRQHVRIHFTAPLGGRPVIPYANPFLSKLLGLGYAEFKKHQFDAVIGWYLEPYGIAAAITGMLFNVPFFVRTAGSDIGRLANHPDLESTYRVLFSQAYAVLGGKTYGDPYKRALDLGMAEQKFVSLRLNRLPKYFSKPAKLIPLDWQTELRNEIAGAVDDAPLWSHYAELNEHDRFDERLPTIGVFGKVGRQKGSFDLVTALEQLAVSNIGFNLIWMPSGRAPVLSEFFAKLRSLRLHHRNVVVVPPVAPWRIPEFLARCDIACVLEREFPVHFHSPRLPREILASGACLVVSREIADKQSFAANLIHMKNCLIVEDPKDTKALAAHLLQLLQDPDSRRYIGKHGQYVSKNAEYFFEPGDSMFNAVVDLCEERFETDANSVLSSKCEKTPDVECLPVM